MAELILRHEGNDYRTEICKIDSVAMDPYAFRVRVKGLTSGWDMLFARVDLENGHGPMKALKKALESNFNVYRVEEIEGQIALLVKDLSGNIVGITSSEQNFSQDPVFREPLGI